MHEITISPYVTLAIGSTVRIEKETLYVLDIILGYLCKIRPLFIKFIKMITAYGALIISISPATCHGSSLSSLVFFFDTYCEEYISLKDNLFIILCPQVAFELERLRGIKKWFEDTENKG